MYVFIHEGLVHIASKTYNLFPLEMSFLSLFQSRPLFDSGHERSWKYSKQVSAPTWLLITPPWYSNDPFIFGALKVIRLSDAVELTVECTGGVRETTHPSVCIKVHP